MSCNLKMAGHRVKWSKLWHSEVVVTARYVWYFWPFSVEGHFGAIRCTCLKMSCNSKTAGHKVKWSKIWDSGVVVACIWGTFDFLPFNVILESFSALVSKWPVIQKQLAIW